MWLLLLQRLRLHRCGLSVSETGLDVVFEALVGLNSLHSLDLTGWSVGLLLLIYAVGRAKRRQQ